MTIPTLTLLIVAAMLDWNPSAEHAFTGEPGLETIARYHALARVQARVALTEEPLPGMTREASGMLLAAVGSMESGGWRRGVVACAEGGDSNQSWTAWGLWGPRGAVCDDLDLAARTAMDRLRSSMVACAYLSPEDRLTQYASGHCGGGRRESRNRWRRAMAAVRAWATP